MGRMTDNNFNIYRILIEACLVLRSVKSEYTLNNWRVFTAMV